MDVADSHLGFRWDKDSRDEWFELQKIRWYENDIYSSCSVNEKSPWCKSLRNISPNASLWAWTCPMT